jgi:hyperosmotically inducible protein
MMPTLSFRTYLLPGLLLLATTLAVTQSLAAQNPASPEHTQVNRADKSSNQPGADRQQMDRSDRDLTEQIRRSIVADKNLSTDAHNVKIITRGGQVTLEGPVQSEIEKRAIEDKSAEIAGQNRVTSELTIKPKR